MNKAIKLKKIAVKNKKGMLFYISKKFNKFSLKRFFIIESNKKKTTRGNHAHKKCDQIFTVINGAAKIRVFRGKYLNFNLKKYESIYVPKKHWVEIYFKNKNSSIIVLCNSAFSKKDYIYDKKKLF